MKTKKIVLTIMITLLVTVNLMFAQDTSRYDKEARKFVGTWKWEKDNSSFKLILKFEDVDFSGNGCEQMIMERIVGYHKFVKNGKIVEDSTPFKDIKININKGLKNTLFGGTNTENKDILEGSITHSSKKKIVKFVIKYIDYNHIKLVKIYNAPGVKIGTPDNPYDSSISLPQNIILTKKK